MQDGRTEAAVTAVVQDPNNTIGSAPGRDARGAARKTKEVTSLRGCKLMAKAIDAKGLEHVAGAAVINRPVEKRGRTKRASNSKRNRLHDLSVGANVELAHIVAVQEVNFALLSSADQQVRMFGATDRIRQNNRSTGAEVFVRPVQGVLVEEGEVIRHGQP